MRDKKAYTEGYKTYEAVVTAINQHRCRDCFPSKQHHAMTALTDPTIQLVLGRLGRRHRIERIHIHQPFNQRPGLDVVVDLTLFSSATNRWYARTKRVGNIQPAKPAESV